MLNARRLRVQVQVQVSFEPVFVGVRGTILSLTFLSPPFPFFLFLLHCVYNGDDTSGLRLGASSRVTFARAPAREIFATRADYRHLPGTVFPSSGNVSDEALKIGSNVLDEAFSVRAIPAPLIWSSFYLQSRAGSVHFRCIYARMHRVRRSTRHSDRTRSLYRINYNVHRSRTCIVIRSMRVSYPGSFGSIISRKEKHNGRGTRTKNRAERSRVCRMVQDFETRSLDAGYLR